jgi:hypothetical protein
MKNKLMLTKFNPSLRLTQYLVCRMAIFGAVVLVCTSAAAQNLFVSGSNSIYEFTPSGVETTFASGLTGPGALAFDSAGNLFVADSDSVIRFTLYGVRSTFADGLTGPYALAFDSADDLFVINGNNIDKFTPEGVRSTFASGLDGPYALAIDSGNNLFVTDSLDVVGPGHGHIYKFTPAGMRSTFASGFISPEGLAFDSAGNPFLVEGGDIDGLGAAIYKFTPGGVRSTFASPFQCIGPGLAIDSANNLFVPDWCTGDIHKFTPGGVESTFVSGSNHATGSFLAFQTQTPPASELTNISTRENALTGDDVLIGGFIITGDTSKQVLLRAIGPSLTNYGVTGCLADPTIELHKPDGTIITNDNWKIADATGQSQEAAIRATTIPPTDDLESALLQTLPPGDYTAIVRAKTGAGIGLVEVYDMDQTSGTLQKLGNMSSRGFVGTGDNVMIGGYVVGPSGPAKVIVRGIGPSLPVHGPLSDPTLELHDGNGNTITSNDNWKIDDASGQSQEATVRATTIPPTNDLESAIVITLSPGAYTAILVGKNGATGIGLIEIYDLQ